MKKILCIAIFIVSLFLFPACSFSNQNNKPHGNPQETGRENEINIITQYFTSGDGSELNPFTISSANDLRNIATLVNEGVTFSQIYIELQNDIDCQNVSWMPIGGCTYDYCFQGVFNGNDFSIKNIIIDDCSYPNSNDDMKFIAYHLGVFGQTKNAEIKNLYVDNVKIAPKSYMIGHNGTNARIGGLIGLARNTKIENCHIKNIEISFEMSLYQYMCVGGLIGQSWNNIAYKSTTDCIIDIRAGGLDCGGLIGSSCSDNLCYCFTKGDITALTNDFGCSVGGLIGKLNYSRSTSTYNENTKEYTYYYYMEAQFKECYSTVNISTSASLSTTTLSSIPDSLVGGFIGSVGDINRTINVIPIYDIGTISMCFSVGNISVNSRNYSIGGFVGNSYTEIPKNNYCIIEQQLTYMGYTPIQGNKLCETISQSQLIEFISNSWNSEIWEMNSSEFPVLK